MGEMKSRLLDLFSGVGGFSLAFERAGFETIAFSEIEPFPCKVLAERWPDVPNLGDITEITDEQIDALGEIDVVTFGSPCQDFSVAGKRLGMQGERSSLFHEAVRVIRRARPTFAVFENVPGLFSSASGWDFAAVLDEMAESGAMDIAWSVLDAQWFGVPQRRRRIFLVADFGGERAGEILSISEGVFRDSAPSREEGEEAANGSVRRSLERGMDGATGQMVAGTLGGGSGHRGWSPDTDRMTFIPEVSFAFNANERWDGESETFVPVSFGWQNSPEQGDEVIENGSAPLRANTTPAVAFAENQRLELRVDRGDPQLTTGGGKPGQGYPAVACFSAGQSEGAGTIAYQPEQSPTLRGAASGTNQVPSLHAGMAVRRLTPKECERLQGFPDSWTNIEGASDSGRYKAMGNSVAVPVVYWIASRMRKEL